MAGFEKAIFSKAGVTLIETMISLIVFSIVIGMSSNLVRKGLDYPFIVSRAESWTSFLEQVNRAILNLPEDTDLTSIRTDKVPLNQIPLPTDLVSWKVVWEDSSINQMKTGSFSANIRQGKKIRWKIYKKTDD